ncbi:hypothetical protein VP01_1892g3 [Puccinia sorghi]|uniref:Uncharacterized protein n=1 Tax=Puccinia sorghi TaxID=27349 RepID=A0A0L6VDI1_9BASI|nr:hypothetical protein VP01_1892g3 [Puccinia sorghi]
MHIAYNLPPILFSFLLFIIFYAPHILIHFASSISFYFEYPKILFTDMMAPMGMCLEDFLPQRNFFWAHRNFQGSSEKACGILGVVILQPSSHPNSTLTVNQSLVESLLKNGWSNNRSFLGLYACQRQEVEQVFSAFLGTATYRYPVINKAPLSWLFMGSSPAGCKPFAQEHFPFSFKLLSRLCLLFQTLSCSCFLEVEFIRNIQWVVGPKWVGCVFKPHNFINLSKLGYWEVLESRPKILFSSTCLYLVFTTGTVFAIADWLNISCHQICLIIGGISRGKRLCAINFTELIFLFIDSLIHYLTGMMATNWPCLKLSLLFQPWTSLPPLAHPGSRRKRGSRPGVLIPPVKPCKSMIFPFLYTKYFSPYPQTATPSTTDNTSIAINTQKSST